MNDRELGYLAGMLDGEGCIVIYPPSRIRLAIVNTDLAVLVKLQEIGFGFGGISAKKSYKDHHTQGYVWTVNGQEAATLLELVKCLLIVKKEKAEEALQFFHNRKGVNQCVEQP